MAGPHGGDWAPLEAVLPVDECADWMHMGTVAVPDCPPVQQYKHYDTRRYVNLALTDRRVRAFAVRTRDGQITARTLHEDPAALARRLADWATCDA